MKINFKAKSLALTVAAVALTGLTIAGGATQAAWVPFIGIILALGTTVLTTFFPSGTVVQGWSSYMWITNIGGILIQGVNLLGDSYFLDPMTVNQVIIILNLIIQTVAREYSK